MFTQDEPDVTAVLRQQRKCGGDNFRSIEFKRFQRRDQRLLRSAAVKQRSQAADAVSGCDESAVSFGARKDALASQECRSFETVDEDDGSAESTLDCVVDRLASEMFFTRQEHEFRSDSLLAEE